MVLFSSEKDKIKRAYNIYKKDRFHKTKWSPNNLGNLIIKEERLIELRRLFVHNDILLKNKCILDVGCAGGNTISLMIELGASEKNIYGIDMPARTELVAHKRSVKEIKKYIKADELIYQNLEDLKRSASIGNPKITEFEDSVFTGNYRVGNITKHYLVNLENTRSDLSK